MNRRQFLGIAATAPIAVHAKPDADAELPEAPNQTIAAAGKPAVMSFSRLQIGVATGAQDVNAKVPFGGFAGRHLVLPQHVAERFHLIDVLVGRRSQLANSYSIPGELFQAGEPRVDFALDSSVRDEDVSLLVENISRDNVDFHGDLHGDVFDVSLPEWPHNERTYLLGYYEELTPLLGRAVVSRPQIVFTPRQLFVPRETLEHFAVRAITVTRYGTNRRMWELNLSKVATMSRSANGHARWTWPKDAIGRPMNACVADQVAVIVENLTDTRRVFRAALLGDSDTIPFWSLRENQRNFVKRVHGLVQKLGVTHYEAVQILDRRINMADMVLDGRIRIAKAVRP